MIQPMVLARTWSENPSGLLWERLWIRDAEGYCAKLVCSGVFAEPQRYESAAEFWTAFEQETVEFNGRRGTAV